MRVPSVYSRSYQQPEVMMTPMIDVVFLLLVFFLWTASFRVVEHLLPSNILDAGGTLPSEVQPELLDLDRVVVRILWQADRPQWTINGNQVDSIDQVQARLDVVAQIQSNLPVLLDPAAQVPLGYVIDVYDRARQVGFSKIQFAAEP